MYKNTCWSNFFLKGKNGKPSKCPRVKIYYYISLRWNILQPLKIVNNFNNLKKPQDEGK